MTDENQRKIDAEITKLLAEVSNLNAATAKLTTENRWYPFIAGAAFFAAVAAFAKLFL
jgi:hypothetical protein